jgi:hypothetical protein
MALPDNMFLAHLLLRADGDPSGRDCYGPGDFGFWPSEEVEACVQAGLLVAAEPSAWVACPACFECGELEVEWMGEPGNPRRYPLVVCPEFGITPIAPAQMQRWRFSLAGLAALLAGDLGATRHREIVANRVWSLGPVTIDGEPRELCLGLGLGRADGVEIVGNAAGRAKAPLAWFTIGAGDLPDGTRLAHAVRLSHVLAIERDADGAHIRLSAAVFDRPRGPSLSLPPADRSLGDPAPVSDVEIRQALIAAGITSPRRFEILKAYLETETVKEARTRVSVAATTIDKRVSEIRGQLRKVHGADYAERIVPYRRPGLKKGR